MDDDYGIKKK